MIDSEAALLGEDAHGRTVRRNRQVVGFFLGLGLLFVLATWLPDLLPSEAAGLASDQVHGVIATMQPATQDSPPTATVTILEGIYAGQGGPATVEGPSG